MDSAHFDGVEPERYVADGSFGKSSPSDGFTPAPGAMEGVPTEPVSWGEARNPLAGVSSGVSIHAGFPNPAADGRLRSLDLNQLLIETPSSTFIFRIRGEEGITQGIFDGDVAVVDRAASVRSNDFVLWHDGEHFKMSRPSRVAEGAIQWGVITAVIHQYR